MAVAQNTSPPARSPGRRTPVAPPPASRAVPPLLVPIWLPLILAAIASGALLAWLVPLSGPGGTPPSVRFTEITSESGITFEHYAGATPAEAPSTLGAGVVLFDYDHDGDPDLFFVNGTDWPWEESLAKHASRHAGALYRNDGAGRFTDITARAGLTLEFHGMAAAAGDFDSDGLTDLVVTGIGANHLFRNRGDGRFEDVTEEAGVGGDANAWHTGATWIDIDADGRLDLVVCQYARWPQEVGLDGAFAVALMGRSYGTPTGFLGAAPVVYRNLGDGRFAVVPGSAGLVAIDAQTGLPAARALAAVPGDVNNDGRLDLLLAFHAHPSVLFIAQAGGSFRRWTTADTDRREGAATAPLPFLPAGGIDERLHLLRALDLGSHAPGMGEEPPAFVGLESRLGLALGDFDRDGRIEALGGNGRIEREINQFPEGRDLAAEPRLLWRDASGTWTAASPAGEATRWTRPVTARAVATADFDGDGDLDAAITQFGGTPMLLRNDSRNDPPWLAVDLVSAQAGRDPGGARVEVHTPRRVQVQTWAPAMGLLAQSSSTLLFGLGEDARVRRIVVLWPDGTRQELRPEGINRRIVIRRPGP